MTSDSLRDHLQAALGANYTIETELGGGGMSRVFVAKDIALGRQVVVKALPAELRADVPVERFRREVAVAARLQHPLVVPLLMAGGVGDALFYLMPLVEGESLRARLQRERQLPVHEALRIARDIADALAYAHAHGIVHRDIKPENVLLSAGHAMVADFGIAKALDTGERLTGTGISIGTPHYMSPEQASGEHDVDGRSDVYSLGCMLYEMLAGEPPFTGPTAQAVIAKRFTQAPTPLRTVRDVPANVEHLVLHTLARVPADRFASGDLVAALDEMLRSPEPGSGREPVTAPTQLLPDARRRPRSRRIAAIGVIVLLALAYGGLRAAGVLGPRSLLARGVLRERDAVLVAEFANRTDDTTLGPVVSMALSTDLSQSRVVAVAQQAVVRSTLTRMRRDPATPLDETLAREVAQRAGLKAVIAGEIGRAGGGYMLSARVIAPDSGTVFAAARETATDHTELLRAIDRLSRTLRRRAGESVRAMRATPPLAQVTTPSLEALTLYTRSYVPGTPLDRATQMLLDAIAIDSGFAMAHRSLGVLYSLTGDRAGIRSSLEQAYRHRDRLTAYERAMTEGTYHRLHTKDLAAAEAAYARAIDLRPEDWRPMDNLGAVYFARGDWDKLYHITRRELAIDSSLWWGYPVLAWLELGRGELRESEATRAAFRRRFPDVADSLGDYATHAWLYRADSLGSILARMRARRHAPWRAAWAEVHGRYREADRELRVTERDSAAAAISVRLRHGYIRAHFEIGRGRPQEAVRLADSLLRLAPLVEDWLGQRPHYTIAGIYARAGQLDKARATQAAYERTASPGERALNDFERRRVLAYVALAEGRYEAAIREFVAMYEMPACFMCVGLPDLGRAYELAGQPDSAIAVYERFLHTPSITRLPPAAGLGYDNPGDGPMLERLAKLYEASGDREKARRAWAEFAELWKDADPELQPRVAHARARSRAP